MTLGRGPEGEMERTGVQASAVERIFSVSLSLDHSIFRRTFQ